MKKVTGIGGIFFKCDDPEKIREWYNKNLGLNTDQHGTSFVGRQLEHPDKKTFSAWSPFKMDSDYFAPSKKEFMINFRVENLVALLEELKADGVKIEGELQEFEYGKFAHIMDPEGNKIELWEPNDEQYDKMVGDQVTY